MSSKQKKKNKIEIIEKKILQPQAQYKENLEELHGTEPSKFKEQI